jgi:hypothetical protein
VTRSFPCVLLCLRLSEQEAMGGRMAPATGGELEERIGAIPSSVQLMMGAWDVPVEEAGSNLS